MMPLYPVTRGQGRQQWWPGPVVCTHPTAGTCTVVRTEMNTQAASRAGLSCHPSGRWIWTIQVCKGKFLRDLCVRGGEVQSTVVVLATGFNCQSPRVAGPWGVVGTAGHSTARTVGIRKAAVLSSEGSWAPLQSRPRTMGAPAAWLMLVTPPLFFLSYVLTSQPCSPPQPPR